MIMCKVECISNSLMSVAQYRSECRVDQDVAVLEITYMKYTSKQGPHFVRFDFELKHYKVINIMTEAGAHKMVERATCVPSDHV